MLFSGGRPLFDSIIQLNPIKWQRVLEDSRVMMSILKKVLLIILDGLTKEHCIAAYLFCKKIRGLVKSSGMLCVCLYLKQCSASLQTAYGGDGRPPHKLSVPVSLNRSGFPRIIPAFHRQRMRKRDEVADQLVQIYLSFFALSKIIALAKRVSYRGTFASIVEPTDLEVVSEWCGEFRDKLSALTRRYIPFVSTIPLNQGFSWVPTWKSLPTLRRVRELFQQPLRELGVRSVTSCFPAILFEMNAFSFLLERVHVSEDHFSQGCLWHEYTRYALDSYNRSITNWCLDQFEKVTGPQLPSYHEIGEPPICGRLGQSIEGGGKRRIFSIGNYLNQRLLRPVHDWLMKVLSKIPFDGTYFQERPLDRLVGKMDCYCFDLSAATDRFPLQVSFEVLQHLFDRSFASSVRSALALNVFEVPFVKKDRRGIPKAVCFVTGQPLGYYSSWPLFALSHHYLVWWCAEKVYPGLKFEAYGILGDDVIIADSSVAEEYKRVLSVLGVKISESKTLVSHSGAAEFAKRFRVRGVSKDLSPISPRALLAFANPMGLVALGLKYHCPRLSIIARVGGAGYRQLGMFDVKRNKRNSRLSAIHSKALFNLENLLLWLGGGKRLDPYLEGQIRSELLSKMKPPKLVVCPENLYVAPKVAEFEEYATLRGWVKLWCNYTRWYYLCLINPEISLSHILDGPYCPSTWYDKGVNEKLIRFGLIWSIYDKIHSKGGYGPVPMLASTPSPREQSWGYVIGGSGYSKFLVRPQGLTQPRAGKGIVLCGISLGTARVDPRLTLIHYKTLGVSDRQSLLDFDRS